ncbi:MAG TPA: MFS transporter, partial [Gaiellaceae bacterium]|nr:MFS transporter [Gaiellaceae bacterium]
LALFVGQAFLYNGVTFNLGDLFSTFYGVSSGFVPVFIIVFAVGNFLGPFLLGRLFDTVGRIPMISGTYLGSAVVAAVLAFLFVGHTLHSPWVFEAFVFATFFLASAGASAAYLTVSEVFPMETRALAIAFFYAVGTGLGGIVGPLLFGHLIATDSRGWVAVAFLIGAGVMALGGIAEIFLGVKAENAQLEDIAKPLTAEEAEQSGRRRSYRPGPGSGEKFYSPGMIGTAGATRSAHPSLRDREIEAIAAALADGGQMRVAELARRVRARSWGPGRFSSALGTAVARGRARRLSRTTVGPGE